jgi:hypothetical protein
VLVLVSIALDDGEEYAPLDVGEELVTRTAGIPGYLYVLNASH